MPYGKVTAVALHLEDFDRTLDAGNKRVEKIAEVLEAATGATLDGRRVLDYGCGVGRVAIPLAARCEHVYGLDISRPTLERAAVNAQERGVENVEWVEPDALAGLAGHYDFVVTLKVLQHIKRDDGERVITQLVRGLRPGGVGWLDVVLRPPHPVRSTLRHVWRSRSAYDPKRKSSIVHSLRVCDPGYVYLMRCSYSLNRLGGLLAREGIDNWHVRFNLSDTPRGFDSAAIVLKK